MIFRGNPDQHPALLDKLQKSFKEAHKVRRSFKACIVEAFMHFSYCFQYIRMSNAGGSNIRVGLIILSVASKFRLDKLNIKAGRIL